MNPTSRFLHRFFFQSKPTGKISALPSLETPRALSPGLLGISTPRVLLHAAANSPCPCCQDPPSNLVPPVDDVDDRLKFHGLEDGLVSGGANEMEERIEIEELSVQRGSRLGWVPRGVEVVPCTGRSTPGASATPTPPRTPPSAAWHCHWGPPVSRCARVLGIEPP